MWKRTYGTHGDCLITHSLTHTESASPLVPTTIGTKNAILGRANTLIYSLNQVLPETKSQSRSDWTLWNRTWSGVVSGVKENLPVGVFWCLGTGENRQRESDVNVFDSHFLQVIAPDDWLIHHPPLFLVRNKTTTSDFLDDHIQRLFRFNFDW